MPHRIWRTAIVVVLLVAHAGIHDPCVAQMPMRELPLVSQIGGVSQAIAVRAGIAFVGQGPRVAVVDVTDPHAPRIIAKSAILPGAVQAIDLNGNYVYVGTDTGLHILEASDPHSLVVLGTLDTASSIEQVHVSGDYAYLAARGVGLGLLVAAVRDPGKPRLAGEFREAVNGVFVSGKHAYVAGGDRLSILDLGLPAYPRLLSSCEVLGSTDVYVDGFYAYVATFDGSVSVVDVSDAEAPEVAGAWRAPSPWGHPMATILGLQASQSYMYVMAVGALHIVDVSDPTVPELTGSFQTRLGYPGGAHVAEGFAYVTDGSGLSVIDVTDPAYPSLAGSLHLYLGPAAQLDVANGHAYVITPDGSLVAVDVRNPSRPVVVGALHPPDLDRLVSVHADDEYVYVLDGGFRGFWGEVDVSGLWVVDVTDPSQMTVAGVLEPLGDPIRLHVSDGHAYVTAGEGGLQVVDVSDPSHPTLVGGWQAPGLVSLESVYASGDYAYAAGGGALWILDIRSPDRLAAVSVCHLGQNPRSVYVSEGYAYVVLDEDYYPDLLQVVDVRDPTRPSVVGTWKAESEDPLCGSQSSCVDVYIDGQYAYIADLHRGVRAVDVRDGAQPVEVADRDTPHSPRALVASNGYVYVADQYGGLLILRDVFARIAIPAVWR